MRSRPLPAARLAAVLLSGALFVTGCGGAKQQASPGQTNRDLLSGGAAPSSSISDSAATAGTTDTTPTSSSSGAARNQSPLKIPGLPTSVLAGGDCAKGPHNASDRGVTPTTLKIGFFIPNTDYANQMGFGIAGGDARKAIKAFIDQINESGGICGRKLTWVATEFNSFDDSDKRAQCIKMAQEEKVFGTIDNLGFFQGGHSCLAENKTPHITYTTGDEATTKSYAPYQWVMRFSMDRLIKNWAVFLKDKGIATSSTKLGLLGADDAQSQRMMKLMKSELSRNGLKLAAEFVSSSDFTVGPTQMADAVLRFKTAGVQVVLPLTSFIHLTSFLNNAQAQAYKPTYTVWHDLTLDLTTTAYPADQFEGTMGQSDSITGQDKAEIPPQWNQQYCLDVYTKRTGDTSATGLTYGLFYCQAIELFGEALRRAGANPTRDSWIQSMGTITDFQGVAVTGPLSFGPNRYHGGLYLATVKWFSKYKDNSNCKCYVQVDPLKRAPF